MGFHFSDLFNPKKVHEEATKGIKNWTRASRTATALFSSPYQAEKYIDDKMGRDFIPGLYKPGGPEQFALNPMGTPATVDPNDPAIRAAGIKELRHLLGMYGRNRTVKASRGFGSALLAGPRAAGS